MNSNLRTCDLIQIRCAMQVEFNFSHIPKEDSAEYVDTVDRLTNRILTLIRKSLRKVARVIINGFR